MGAANRRFEPRRLLGLPLLVVAGAVSSLIALVLALMLPALGRCLFLGVAVLGVAAIGIGLRYGDDLPFIGVILAARQERRRHLGPGWVRQ